MQRSRVTLKDALFLCHAKPKDAEQDALWKRLIAGELTAPDTWERAISAASPAEKQATWTRLLTEKKLGDMALLMNLRNLIEAKVDPRLVETEIRRRTWAKILPFRFVSAWRAAPAFAEALNEAMVKAMAGTHQLPGSAILVVDVSSSMDMPLSERSTLSRLDAAGALAVLLREACEHVRVITFSDRVMEVPNVRGLALLELIHRSQPHHSTHLAQALDAVQAWPADWIFVITDEQAHDGIIPSWATQGAYVVNVAPYQPALPTTQKGWTRISGFSERLLDWIEVTKEGA